MTTALEGALGGLYARASRGMRLGTGAMQAACDALGNPERAFEVVHVAGTNGKGSVSAMVESILRADGRRTGLYTSPHLCRFAERIRVGGAPLDDDTLARLLGFVLVAAPDLSFFETTTLAALVAFREAKVDVAVLEVGIGGRLDATNVVPAPRAAAITRIAFDHTDRLGDTLVAIAREKAGIAKPGLEIVLGPVEPDVVQAIDEVARARGATTLRADLDAGARRFVESATIGLPGAHQIENAEVAYLLGTRMGASARAIAEGIAQVRWPGRLERLERPDGPYLLDAAHNPDGAASLARYLTETKERFTLVFGALSDKPWTEMLDLLAPLGTERVYVAPPLIAGVNRAAADPRDFAARHPGSVASGVAEACRIARSRTKERDLVVICGSIFLVGEARGHLLGLPRDPPIPL